MNDKEKELVTEEFISRDDSYNIRVGGQNSDLTDLANAAREKFLEMIKTDSEFRKRFSDNMRTIVKQRWEEHPECYTNFINSKHTTVNSF